MGHDAIFRRVAVPLWFKKMLKKLQVQMCDARMMHWKTNDRPIKNLYDTLCICSLAAPFEFLLLTFELET